MTPRRLAMLASLGTLILAAPSAASGEEAIFGVWRNPKNTVHVDIRPCGAAACGDVVWATPGAQAEARKGSGRELVGLQLLRDATPTGEGSWRGKVFVPDLNVTLTGVARPLEGARLRLQGCLLGRVLCKSQYWVRIAALD